MIVVVVVVLLGVVVVLGGSRLGVSNRDVPWDVSGPLSLVGFR